MTTLRYALVFFSMVGIIVVPSWIPLVLMGALAFLYRSWEVILIGLYADLIWLAGGVLGGVPFFTLAGLVLAWGLEPLRNELFSMSR